MKFAVQCTVQRLPCVKGKRSAVAEVNDSPVGCQSRDRAARRRLSAKLTEGLTTPPPLRGTSPYTGEALVRCKTVRQILLCSYEHLCAKFSLQTNHSTDKFSCRITWPDGAAPESGPRTAVIWPRLLILSAWEDPFLRRMEEEGSKPPEAAPESPNPGKSSRIIHIPAP